MILRQPRPHGLREHLYFRFHRLRERSHTSALLDFRCHSVMAGPPPPPTPTRSDKTIFEEAGPDSSAWIAEFEPDHACGFSAAWHNGARCFTASRAGNCTGFVWIASGPCDFHGLALNCIWRLPPHCAWIFDLVGQGTALPLARWAIERLAREGVTDFCGQIEFGNPLSFRVFRALGAAPAGWIASLRLGSIWLHLDRSRNRGFRLHRGQTPLDLSAFLPRAQPVARPAPEPVEV